MLSISGNVIYELKKDRNVKIDFKEIVNRDVKKCVG